MKPKISPRQKQGNFLYQDLLEQLNPKAPLLILAKRLSWEMVEREFAPLYAEVGRPAKPVRLMVGLFLLKQIENLSDERIVEAWVQNPYCLLRHGTLSVGVALRIPGSGALPQAHRRSGNGKDFSSFCCPVREQGA